jgi:Cu/Ag efflux pump CusA
MMTPLSIGIPRIDTASDSDRRGLLPIMFGGGTDSEMMRRIAAPMIGGMIGAPILSMLVLSVAYLLLHRQKLRRSPNEIGA